MGKYFGTDGFRGEANVTLTVEHAYRKHLARNAVSLLVKIQEEAAICLSIPWWLV